MDYLKKIGLLGFCSMALFGSAQNSFNSYLKDATTSREHSLDILKMRVEVSFDAQKGLVKGKVLHQFKVLQKSVDSVFFDAPGIQFSSVKLNGLNQKYSATDKGIWVVPSKAFSWDQTGEIEFVYTATPRKGIYFIGWNIPEPKVQDAFAVRKQIWTQGQGIDNRYWIPMYDDMNDKFITETITTFDKDYQVLSNGKLLSKKANKDGTITWHYAMSKPHAGYLLMLGIGKYAVATAKSKSGVPLNFWYYPEFAERMEPTFRYSAQMIDFLEAQTGIPYPWESYSQIMVQDFLYGAMENTTATIFGDFFNVDSRAFLDRNYIGVNCHELTHQWFGDYITARDSRDAWLQESFATYFPKQLSKVLDGVEEWDWQRRAHQNSAIEAGKKDNFAVRHTSGGTARVYPKGAAVISMLEYVLGEEQWKRVLTQYLKTHAYANVETNDLQQAIKDVLGLNLDWFFDEWILRGGEPSYVVHYEDLSYQDGSRATEVAIEQIQKTDETIHYFKMPIIIEVYYQDGSKDEIKEMMDEAFEVVKIPNRDKKKIAYVLFDPNSNILKQVRFKKSMDELRLQLNGAKHMLDRYDALVAMRSFSVEEKRESLLQVLHREKHEGILMEAISQLALDQTEKSQNALLKMAKFGKASVRDHYFKTLEISALNATSFEMALKDSSYDVVKTVLEKLCRYQPQKASDYLKSTENVEGMFHTVKMKWLELSIINKIGEEEARAQLSFFASSNFEFRTRNQAFLVLKSTNTFNAQVIESLFQAMLSTNGRLAGPASELANYFSSNLEYRNQMKSFFQEHNYSEKEKEILLKNIFLLKN
ncbi:MAG: M1 family metallopeptidase [Bacteroidia bacterium]|nr:M1 family metallopeptidase [Bacteroidia bacterium]MCF8427041.1 M1 family metallopeptidase [Bacteroidia bacterium]MCF8447136.1 M1 family metallopeptidase [Bacteroidia bacterium]